MSEHASFSIRIVDADGNGVSGAKVSCQYGTMSGVGTEYTDDDGWATFDIVEGVLGGRIPIENIWVDGKEISDDVTYMDDGDTFSFTLP